MRRKTKIDSPKGVKGFKHGTWVTLTLIVVEKEYVLHYYDEVMMMGRTNRWDRLVCTRPLDGTMYFTIYRWIEKEIGCKAAIPGDQRGRIVKSRKGKPWVGKGSNIA